MLNNSTLAIRALAFTRRGDVLHRTALEALEAGKFETAQLMFEAAVWRYRRDLAVEAIARARVHQLMAQVLSGAEPECASERCLEVERRLCQLDRIESLASPHELVDAHTMLGSWLDTRVADEAMAFANFPLSRAA